MSAARVLAALQDCLETNGLARGGVLLAAVSGGADSMALLCGLQLLRSRLPFTLHACHVQHGLRGEESREDEAFVRRWCECWQVPLTVHYASLGGDPCLPGMETRARECRRTFFAGALAAIDGDALLLAHHQGDQTETVLMHLIRGAGAGGLSGMQHSAPFADRLLLRPFLNLSKQTLLEALDEWGVPHREDHTNSEAITLRNRLRLEVLPLLEQLSPGSGERIAQASALLRQDEQALAAMAQKLYTENSLLLPGLHALSLSALLAAPEATAVRALRLWYRSGLERCGLAPKERSLSLEDSCRLLALASAAPGQQVNLPCGLAALRGKSWLHLLRQDGQPLQPIDAAPVPLEEALRREGSILPLPGWQSAPGEPLLFLTLSLETPLQPPADAMTAYLPENLLADCVLRTPCREDHIHPLGAPGAKPLRRWLTDRKIDAPFRPLVPVLALKDTILWIPGLCTAQLLSHIPGRRCLCLYLNTLPPYLPNTNAKET